ncbi:MAG: carbohydrate ABC transporter permease [Spirochaetales bacterium]|nr:carbohydrate ABC transporter permease [Spirochaetales bacterium]
MRRLKAAKDELVFQFFGYIILGVIGFITIFPFLVLIGSSFASEKEIITQGYTVLPRRPACEAYGMILRNPQKIIRAYGVTIFITGAGTIAALFISAMTAYVISRKTVKYRNVLAFFLYFTTLFNGGLAPYYIVVSNVYHLRNSLLVLLLVPMFNVFYILILRNFIRAIPESLVESAQIEGAGDFYIFIRIILPLTKPALASIGLFTALFYWNDWWTAMMFVDTEAIYPLQYVLYQILSSVNVAAYMVNNIPSFNMPKETLKLAMTVVSTGPVIFLYVFAQKYFVKGVTLGAVKG